MQAESKWGDIGGPWGVCRYQPTQSTLYKGGKPTCSVFGVGGKRVCDSVQGVSQQAIRRKGTAASKHPPGPHHLSLVGPTRATKVRLLKGELGGTTLCSLLGLQAARAKLEGARAAPKLEGGAQC